MTTGDAATSRSASEYTAAATQNSIMQTKNTRRPSRRPSIAGNNYASSLVKLERFEEARSLLRQTIPVARRVLGESRELTLELRWIFGEALYNDEGATLDDLREAVTTLAEITRTARRVMGGTHPRTVGIEGALREAWALLRAHETPPAGDK